MNDPPSVEDTLRLSKNYEADGLTLTRMNGNVSEI